MALKWHVAHIRPLAEYVARDHLETAGLAQLFEQRATFVVAPAPKMSCIRRPDMPAQAARTKL